MQAQRMGERVEGAGKRDINIDLRIAVEKSEKNYRISVTNSCMRTDFCEGSR